MRDKGIARARERAEAFNRKIEAAETAGRLSRQAGRALSEAEMAKRELGGLRQMLASPIHGAAAKFAGHKLGEAFIDAFMRRMEGHFPDEISAYCRHIAEEAVRSGNVFMAPAPVLEAFHRVLNDAKIDVRGLSAPFHGGLERGEVMVETRMYWDPHEQYCYVMAVPAE